MVVRKVDVPSASWKLSRGLSGDYNAPMSSQKFSAAMTKAAADKDIGPTGVKVLKLAYEAAKTAAKKDPTRGQIGEALSKTIGSLTNERAKGRINDGYIDAREAASVKGDLAAALYKYVNTSPAFTHGTTADKDLKARASTAQVTKALKNLNPVIDAGFKLFKADPDKYQEGPGDALREAANAAHLPSGARAALLTALNGVTTRSDGGDWPEAADVKGILATAQSKLKSADGAAIVDFDNPNKAPTKKKDGITTGTELDRTPSATGMTARALLAYAGSL